jgi:indoleamine 2,3-dioxygenase
MRPPVPRLEDYGITKQYGFLPPELPAEKLQDPYYGKWEAVVSNLQALILSRRLRGVVKKLPVLSTAYLHDEAEWRRAYMMLAFMTHAYIWGDDMPEEVG